MSERRISRTLRRHAVERAKGLCEYCRTAEEFVFAPHQLDHIIAIKHGGATSVDNLALSCALCNKHKGSDIASVDPETNAIVALFHPRRHRWNEHFRLASDGRMIGLSASGRVTVRLLRMNDPNRVEERRLILEIGELPV